MRGLIFKLPFEVKHEWNILSKYIECHQTNFRRVSQLFGLKIFLWTTKKSGKISLWPHCNNVVLNPQPLSVKCDPTLTKLTSHRHKYPQKRYSDIIATFMYYHWIVNIVKNKNNNNNNNSTKIKKMRRTTKTNIFFSN